MNKRVSAKPFAKALFDVALAAGRLEATGEELTAVAGLVAEHAELSRILAHPAVPPTAKREIIDRVAAETGASMPLRKLLGLLADNDALRLLPRVHEAFEARLRAYQGVVDAHVTTAVPLPREKADAIAQGLQQATGKQVQVTTGVDPSIMGGVVARLGSIVYDGSVVRHLERIRERLVGESA